MVLHFIYNQLIGLANLILPLLGIFSKKINDFVQGRKSTIEKIKETFNNRDKIIWIHSSSLGEFEQGSPIISEIKKTLKEYKILVTFFSPSGYNAKKKSKQVDLITYLPIDSRKNVKTFLDAFHPRLVILIKYEFWPNYLIELDKRNITVISASSIFRPSQFLFKSVFKNYQKILSTINHFFVQNETSKSLLSSIGINQVTISGDTRFDRVYGFKNRDNKLDIITSFVKNEFCFIAGSTWKEDYNLMEELFIKKVNKKIIIAPHDVSPKSLKALEKKIKKPYAKWSSYNKKIDSEKNILIIDVIGVLTKVYSYASLVYVGGGMGKKGLHNILEPAIFSVPIIIGKNFSKFKEAFDLVRKRSVFKVESKTDFVIKYKELYGNKNAREKSGKINYNYIKDHKGASKKIKDYIVMILSK